MSGLIDLASLDDAALAAIGAGGGGQSLTRTAVKTAAYTASSGDLIPVDTTAGNVTVTLPTAPADKAKVTVKHIIQGGTNTVSVACGGSDVLNKTGGNTSATLTLVNQGATYEYQASTHIWTVTAGDLPLTGLTGTFAPLAGSTNYAPRLGGLNSSAKVRAMATETSLSPGVTFTDSTSTTSTLTSPRQYGALATNAPFRYNLSDTTTLASIYVIPYGPTTNVARTGDTGQSMTVEFDFDGQTFEVDTLRSIPNTSFRIWANEAYSATFTGPSTSTRALVKVDLGSRAYRRIVLEMDTASSFAGLWVAGTDTVTPPSQRAALKVAGVGDSYMFGQGYLGTSTSARSWFSTFARTLGATNWRRYGVSGTGFIATTGNSGQTYINRISDVVSFAPDICVVQGSINDSTQTGAAITAAATTYLTALKVALPNTTIVLTSPMRPLVATAADATSGAALSVVATTLGLNYVDALALPWFTGSGSTSATTGLGNSDFYQSGTSAAHPSPAGHIYMGTQVAREVSRLLGLGL